MKYRLISKILGTGLILFSAIQSFPIIISLIYNEQNYLSFLESSLITFASGLKQVYLLRTIEVVLLLVTLIFSGAILGPM